MARSVLRAPDPSRVPCQERSRPGTGPSVGGHRARSGWPGPSHPGPCGRWPPDFGAQRPSRTSPAERTIPARTRGDGMGDQRVLVAFANRAGSTAGIAGSIATVLRRAGLSVECRLASEVEDVTGYDAVILGSGLYVPRRSSDGGGFLARHRAALATKALWLFCAGPIGRGRGPDGTVGAEPDESQRRRGGPVRRGPRHGGLRADRPAGGRGSRWSVSPRSTRSACGPGPRRSRSSCGPRCRGPVDASPLGPLQAVALAR